METQKYEAIVQVRLYIEAESKELAKSIARSWDGEAESVQAGVSGWGKLESKERKRLVSLKKRGR